VPVPPKGSTSVRQFGGTEQVLIGLDHQHIVADERRGNVPEDVRLSREVGAITAAPVVHTTPTFPGATIDPPATAQITA